MWCSALPARIEGGSDPKIGKTDHEPDINLKAGNIDKHNRSIIQRVDKAAIIEGARPSGRYFVIEVVIVC